ncbi:MAG: ABC transporter ATP-binding protein [Desulfobacterales bacterium]|nr:ABC transporter ATP-binding protein [Desulfobacterales bacterium]
MILTVNQVDFRYKSVKILEDISFSVPRGEITVILGPNGVGKTTLLKCLNKILTPSTGRIDVKGQPLKTMDIRRIAKEISYVAQHHEAGKITVFDAVLMGRYPHIRFTAAKEDLTKTGSVLDHLNLTHMALKNLYELSGGELQQVAIARALVQETDILLLDEPTSSLDLKNQTRILTLVRDIAQDHNLAVIMTMHDLNSALRYADRYICLKSHTVFGAGKIEEIRSDLLTKVYGLPVEIIRHKGYPLVVPLEGASKAA